MPDNSLQVLLSNRSIDLFNAFSECFDLRIAYFSASGKEQAVGEGKDCCGFCRCVREKLGKLPVCLEMDDRKRKEALQKKRMILYTCHAGMTEAVLPLHYEDLHIGYIMIGQFRTRRRPSKSLRAEWCARGFEADELQAAFENTPYYSDTKARSIVKLFQMLADYITSRRLVQLRERAVVDRIEAFLRKNISATVTLSEVAAQVNRSVSSISHLMKNLRGRGVKEFHISMKCDAAEEMLRELPGFTVKEAAAAVGFDDPYYFSRLFKRYRGYPPSQCKNR